MCHMYHTNGSASDLAPYTDFIKLKCMKSPSYEMLEASNKIAFLFQDLFSYSADKSTEQDKC